MRRKRSRARSYVVGALAGDEIANAVRASGCLALQLNIHQAEFMRITPVGEPTWDDFADRVLPLIGLSDLRLEMQQICPSLAAERIDH